MLTIVFFPQCREERISEASGDPPRREPHISRDAERHEATSARIVLLRQQRGRRSRDPGLQACASRPRENSRTRQQEGRGDIAAARRLAEAPRLGGTSPQEIQETQLS